MPIYEYECKKCGHHLEAIQKFSDAPLTKCPECGKETLEKCISLPSFQLKGSGWYETDFKDKKQDKQKDKPDSKKQETKTKDKKTETKKDGG